MKAKAGNIFCKWRKIKSEFPQELITDSLHSIIFINDMFVLAKKTLLCNIVNDNMWYSCDKTFGQAVTNQQNDFRYLKNVLDSFLIWLSNYHEQLS